MEKTPRLKLPIRILTFLSIPLLLFTFQAGGQNEQNGFLDIRALQEAGDQITPNTYPNATHVLVDGFIRATYEPDGRSNLWDDTTLKILNERGRKEHETLSFYFTLPYSEVELTLLQILRQDGTVINIDIASQSRVMIDQSQMASNIYNPNSKILQVGIPDLQLMDMIRFVARRNIVKPRVPNTWSEYKIMEYTYPIRHLVYEVIAPSNLPLQRIAIKDPVENTVIHTRSKHGEKIIYRWEVQDVPRIFEEPNMPPIYTVVQRLLLSTISDWEILSRWYWELCEPRLATTQAMEDKVKTLVEGLTTEEEKIQSIFRFVSQKIRYMGITIEEEAPGYEPHDVSLTFNNRHGVCRDKAALLVAMLRLAGFQSYPVLIHVGPKKDAEVPQPYFNHAITAIQVEDGSLILMDATDENTQQIFPAYLCNMSYLVAKPEGDILRTSPIEPAENHLVKITTTGHIDLHGNLAGESLLLFDGINDNAYRGYFSRLKPQERQRYFEGILKRMSAGTHLKELEISPTDMLNTKEPLQVRLRFETKDVLVGEANCQLLPLPTLGTRVGMVNFIVGKTGLKERRYPLDTRYACGIQETLDLTIDPSLGELETIPCYPTIQEESVHWTRSLVAEGSHVKAQGTFLLTAVEFDSEQYVKLRSTLEEMEYQDRRRLLLKRDSPLDKENDDVLHILTRMHYELEDSHTWTLHQWVSKKILTYKGMKENSEIKILYNPIWEEVNLISARVVSGEKVHEISEQEINIMDDSWVGSAPRYPPNKILVASLPGVEIGSIIEYETRHRCFDRPFFFTRQSFQEKDPIQKKELLLEMPPGIECRLWTWDPDSTLEKEYDSTKDAMIYRWSVRDQKGIQSEDNLPPWWSLAPTVAVSTGEWKEFSRNTRTALREKTCGRRTLSKAIKERLGKNPSLEEIRDHVSKTVRLVGPGMHEMPLSCLSLPATTYREGYGNSGDRAVLMYSALKSMGYRPRWVLASWSPLEQGLQNALLAAPDPSLFSNLLIQVKRPEGILHLNDTDQYAKLGTTLHEGRLGLCLKKGRPTIIHPPMDLQNRKEEHYLLRIGLDGDALIQKTVYHYGDHYGNAHRLYDEMPPEEKRRHHLELLGQLSRAAEPMGDLITDFVTYPGIERYTAQIRRFAIREQGRLYFELPASLDHILRLRSTTRQHPFYQNNRLRERIEIAIRFEGFSFSPQDILLQPPEFNWVAPRGAGSLRVRTAQKEAADWIIAYETDLDPVIWSAQEYPQIYEIVRQLDHPRSKLIMIQIPDEAHHP